MHVQNIGRGFHQNQNVAAPDADKNGHHHGKNTGQDGSISYIPAQRFPVSCPEHLRNRNCKSAADSHTESHDHEVDRTCTANSRERFRA